MTDITALLNQAAEGDAEALNRAYPTIYEELRRLARSALGSAQPGRTLGITSLVHEAFLRLAAADSVTWRARHEFFAYAARVMRNLIVDAARQRATTKHGGDLQRCDEALELIAGETRIEDVLAVDQSLTRLAEIDPRLAEVVELHVFAGMPFVEIAQCLDVAKRTVMRDWSKARLLLQDLAVE